MNRTERVRAFAIALLAWSGVVVGLLVFLPVKIPAVPCGRLVGTWMDPDRAARCQALIDAANNQVFWFQWFPFLVAVAAGYLAIAFIALRRRAADPDGSTSVRAPVS